MKWWANIGKKVSESKQLEAGTSLIKEFWRGHWYADGLFNFKPKERKKKKVSTWAQVEKTKIWQKL